MDNDNEIPESEEAKIPRFLLITYIIVFLTGLALIFFWNGSRGWFDRGSWHKLQEAAKTTYHFDKNFSKNSFGKRGL